MAPLVTYEVTKLAQNADLLADLAQQAKTTRHRLVANNPYFSVSDMMEMERINDSIERMAKKAHARYKDELKVMLNA